MLQHMVETSIDMHIYQYSGGHHQLFLDCLMYKILLGLITLGFVWDIRSWCDQPPHGISHPAFAQADQIGFDRTNFTNEYPALMMHWEFIFNFQRGYRNQTMIKFFKYLAEHADEIYDIFMSRYRAVRLIAGMRETTEWCSANTACAAFLVGNRLSPEDRVKYDITNFTNTLLTWPWEESLDSIGFQLAKCHGPSRYNINDDPPAEAGYLFNLAISILFSDQNTFRYPISADDEHCPFEFRRYATDGMTYDVLYLLFVTDNAFRNHMQTVLDARYRYVYRQDSVQVLNPRTWLDHILYHSDKVKESSTVLQSYMAVRTKRTNRLNYKAYETPGGLWYIEAMAYFDQTRCLRYHQMIKPHFIFYVPAMSSTFSSKLYSRDLTRDYFLALYDLFKFVFPNSTLDVLTHTAPNTLCSTECTYERPKDPRMHFAKTMQYINLSGGLMLPTKTTPFWDIPICYGKVVEKADNETRPVLVIFGINDAITTNFENMDIGNYVQTRCGAKHIDKMNVDLENVKVSVHNKATNTTEYPTMVPDYVVVTNEDYHARWHWLAKEFHNFYAIYKIPKKSIAESLAKLPYQLQQVLCLDPDRKSRTILAEELGPEPQVEDPPELYGLGRPNRQRYFLKAVDPHIITD